MTYSFYRCNLTLLTFYIYTNCNILPMLVGDVLTSLCHYAGISSNDTIKCPKFLKKIRSIRAKVKTDKMHSLRIQERAEKLSEFPERFLRKFRKTPTVSAEILKSFSLHSLFFAETAGMEQDKNIHHLSITHAAGFVAMQIPCKNHRPYNKFL